MSSNLEGALEFKNSQVFFETIYNRFPTSYKMVLNNSGEVVIGDTLIWYTRNGKKHLVPNKDEKQMKSIQSRASESKIVFNYTSKPLNRVPGKNNINSRVSVWDLDARYQWTWNWRDDSNVRRKFVDELYVWRDDQQYWSQLYIRIKDERWAQTGWFSYDWRSTQDHRQISYNVSWSATFIGGYRNTPYAGPQEFVGSQSNFLDIYSDYQIFIATDRWMYGPDDSWSVEVSGTIWQWLPNDYGQNFYQITNSPLW